MSKEINFGPLNNSDPEALGKMDVTLHDGNRLLLLKGELDGMGKNALNICPDVLWYKKEWV